MFQLKRQTELSRMGTMDTLSLIFLFRGVNVILRLRLGLILEI